MHGSDLLLAEQRLLLSYDASGKPVRRTTNRLHHALTAALVEELIERGRLGLDGRDRLARLTLPDPTPTDHPALDPVLVAAADWVGQRPWRLVGDHGRPVRRTLLEGLAERGLVRRAEQVVAGLVQRPRWFDDEDVVADVREQVRAVLVDGVEPDRRSAALIALVHALGNLDLVVPGDAGPAVARADLLVGDHWITEAMQKVRNDTTTKLFGIGLLPSLPALKGLNRT